MKLITTFVKNNPFVVFVVLAYLLSWWPALLAAGLLPHGPLFAALLVLWLSEGKAGVHAWWRQLMQRSVAWRWYAVAAAIPVVISFTGAGLNFLLGAQLAGPIDWTIPFTVLPMMLLLSGMWEEPGWIGFALPHLYKRFGSATLGTLTATLIMAVIRAGWHLPLMLSGSVYWSDLVFLLAFQFVFTWLFNGSGGAVLAVMFCHLLNNIFDGAFVSQWFTGADWMSDAWLRAALWSLLALALLFVVGLQLGRKPAVPTKITPVGQSLAAQ